MKFRKKPVVIDAVQLRWDTWSDVCQLLGSEMFRRGAAVGCFTHERKETEDGNKGIGLKIKTLEGWMLACDGDWIIRGVAGEFYPCKPEIFEATYEAV